MTKNIEMQEKSELEEMHKSDEYKAQKKYFMRIFCKALSVLATEAWGLGVPPRLGFKPGRDPLYFKKLCVHFQELMSISTKQWGFQPL